MDIFKSIDSELALFAGAGGGLLGSKILGFRTVGAVECEAYPNGVLQQRQNDGSLDPFPIWDDVCTFRSDNDECRDYIQWLQSIADRLIISGGFPCQDISVAGKGKGIEGENSGLWREYARIIREVGPAVVYVENSPLLTKRGVNVVLGNLAEMGYDAVWGVLGASDVGANHHRKRIWILAYADQNADRGESGKSAKAQREVQQQYPVVQSESASNVRISSDVSNTNQKRRGRGSSKRRIVSGQGKERHANEIERSGKFYAYADQINDDGTRHGASETSQQQKKTIQRKFSTNPNQIRSPQNDQEKQAGQSTQAHPGSWWQTEPDVGRVVDGLAFRVDRLKAIGNGQVPACMAAAFSILSEIISHPNTKNIR